MEPEATRLDRGTWPRLRLFRRGRPPDGQRQSQGRIIKACFHEPMVNRTYADMARHYGTAIVPARPYKPRDKATASYCTSFGDLHGDGNEPGWVGRFSA